jgi:hypothetical protein
MPESAWDVTSISILRLQPMAVDSHLDVFVYSFYVMIITDPGILTGERAAHLRESSLSRRQVYGVKCVVEARAVSVAMSDIGLWSNRNSDQRLTGFRRNSGSFLPCRI